MKSFNASTVVSAGVIAASLLLVPLNIPAQAQTNTGTTSAQQDRNQAGPIRYNTESDHNNWGWLGLLGLAGLAGLAKKNRHTTVHSVNDPNIGVRSGNDFR